MNAFQPVSGNAPPREVWALHPDKNLSDKSTPIDPKYYQAGKVRSRAKDHVQRAKHKPGRREMGEARLAATSKRLAVSPATKKRRRAAQNRLYRQAHRTKKAMQPHRLKNEANKRWDNLYGPRPMQRKESTPNVPRWLVLFDL